MNGSCSSLGVFDHHTNVIFQSKFFQICHDFISGFPVQTGEIRVNNNYFSVYKGSANR